MFSKTKDTAVPAASGNSNSKKALPSIVSNEMHILGNLVSEGAIDVDGAIDGNIKAEHVTIRSNGKIKGDIVAQTVHIYGNVQGLVRAHAVHLYASCHMEGVIMHQTLSIEDGAFVDGKFKRFSGSSLQADTDEFSDDSMGILEDKPMLSNGSLRLIG